MSDLKLATEIDDDNPVIGDLYLSSGRAALTDDESLESTAQQLRIRFQFILGEHFADLRLGIKYIASDEQGILGNKIDKSALAVVLRRTMETTPGVASVAALTVDFDGATRQVTVLFEATHITGRLFTSDDFAPFIVEI